MHLEDIPIHYRDIVRKHNEFLQRMECAILSKSTYVFIRKRVCPVKVLGLFRTEERIVDLSLKVLPLSKNYCLICGFFIAIRMCYNL